MFLFDHIDLWNQLLFRLFSTCVCLPLSFHPYFHTLRFSHHLLGTTHIITSTSPGIVITCILNSFCISIPSCLYYASNNEDHHFVHPRAGSNGDAAGYGTQRQRHPDNIAVLPTPICLSSPTPTKPCHPSLITTIRFSTSLPLSISKVCFRGFSYTNLIDEDQKHLVKNMSFLKSIFTFLPCCLFMTSMHYMLDPEMTNQIWALLTCHVTELTAKIYADDDSAPQEPVELIPMAFSMGSVMMTEFMATVHAWFETHLLTFEGAGPCVVADAGRTCTITC